MTLVPNPITGILGVPLRDDSGETAQVEVMEQIPGETEFDQIAKAQAGMPHVRARIEELEACVWALAEQLILHEGHNAPLVERAKILLRERLEIFDDPDPTASDVEVGPIANAGQL